MLTKAAAELALVYDSKSAFMLLETGGDLQAKRMVDGVETTLKTIPYDLVNHAYLGISELGGDVRWETSLDGKTWSTITQAPSSLPSAVVYLKLGASTAQMEPIEPGETYFDDVNVMPP